MTRSELTIVLALVALTIFLAFCWFTDPTVYP